MDVGIHDSGIPNSLSTCDECPLCAQVTLAWDPNNEPGVAGYRIYYSLLRRQCSSSVDAGNQTSYTLSNLEDGKTYYFAATAYDQYGDESDFSDEVIFNVPPFDKRHSC
jgi:fibronectin type 3 domain-containing protein